MDNFDEKDSKQDSSPEKVAPVVVKKESERKIKIGLFVWRFVSFLMTIFFVLAAGVQFNDPDPWLWVPLYGIASLLTGCLVFRPNLCDEKPWQYTYFVHAAYSAALFVYVLVALVIAFRNPEADGTLNPLTYEEGRLYGKEKQTVSLDLKIRELAGILITTVWLLICKQTPIIKCPVPKCSFVCCKKTKRGLFIRNKAPDYGHTSLLPPPV